ncbi:MAG: TIGR01620 family protein, partial [Bradyrhizobium sp.]
MNEKTPPRRPATFKLDDPGVVVMDPEDSGRLTRGTIWIVPEAEPAQLPVPADTPLLPARRGFRWGTLFWSAVAGLVVLRSGRGGLNLIVGLFARHGGLGFRG